MSATGKVWNDNSPPNCAAADLNGFKNENNNLITASGQALNTADNDQTSIAATVLSHVGNWYTDTGSGTAYVLTIAASGVAIDAIPAGVGYADGMEFRFRPATTNTSTTPTVNVSTLGAITIVRPGGGALSLGDITTDEDAILRYDSGSGNAILTNPQATVRQWVDLAAATATGAFFDVTGIVSSATQVRVFMRNISLNAVDRGAIQLGHSGGIISAGYVGRVSDDGGDNDWPVTRALISNDNIDVGAGDEWFFEIFLKKSPADNTWGISCTGLGLNADTNSSLGEVDVTAALDRIRFTTENGTDTYDNGEVWVSYYG